MFNNIFKKIILTVIISIILITTSNFTQAQNKLSTVQEDIYNEQTTQKDENPTKESDTLEESQIVEVYNSNMPETLVKNLKYTKYKVPENYLLITGYYANVREKPTTQSEIITTASRFEKVPLLSKVTGESGKINNTNHWYKVLLNKDSKNPKIGYIFSTLGKNREVNIDKMYKSVEALKNEVDNNKTGYISNYRNYNGIAPLFNGSTQDSYGIKRYQSAPAYVKPDPASNFRYIQDGVLVSIVDETEKYYKIRSLNFKWEYYVEKRYVTFNNSIENLTKAIVIDRDNQNEGVFEYIDGKWTLVSVTYATTGALSKYKQPTDLGYYMAIVTEPQFLYLDDITRELQGYAPYTIRFNGGAYIHGVPVNFKKVDDRLIKPPHIEYSHTIGTVPLSHKCIRNYTSHAKFLYDWVEIGKSAVIVIE